MIWLFNLNDYIRQNLRHIVPIFKGAASEQFYVQNLIHKEIRYPREARDTTEGSVQCPLL
ncbi:hypothetical protein C2U53_18195 [Citrobacter sp. CFNIH10]|nr:hypothetical protein C2U53_18195 [Citrobacter sp. CFNIH10]